MILSNQWIEEVTFERLKEKLEKHIRWGYNCDSVRNALEFESEWLLGGFEPYERAQVEEYIIHNGFYQKVFVEAGRKFVIWYLNSNTTNATFQKVVEMYKDSFRQEEKRFEEEIRDLIRKFLNSWYEITVAKTDNNLFRTIITNILAEKRNIKYSFSFAKDWVILSKTGSFKGFPENYNRDYEEGFVFWSGSKFRCAKIDLDFLKLFNKPIPKYLKISVPPCYTQRFKNIFNEVGFRVKFMPELYDEEKYFECDIGEETFTTLWLEAYRVRYSYILGLGPEVNEALKTLCEYFE